MRAAIAEQPKVPRSIPIENQVLAQKANGPCAVPFDLRAGGDRLPVAAHQLAGGRPWPKPGHPFVLFLGEQVGPPSNRGRAYRSSGLPGAGELECMVWGIGLSTAVSAC